MARVKIIPSIYPRRIIEPGQPLYYVYGDRTYVEGCHDIEIAELLRYYGDCLPLSGSCQDGWTHQRDLCWDTVSSGNYEMAVI